MKTLLISNIGSFPRIGEENDHQRFRRGYTHFERKEISAHAFRDVEQSVIHELVHDQENCGVDEVTDGLVSWEDPISHFCKNVSGAERTGLARYFETNFYYRRPMFASKPKIKEPLIAREFAFAKSITRKTVRAILTGPLTLAVHTGSFTKHLATKAARLDFFTDLIALEVKALAQAGATVIQIDEPSLAAEPADLRLVRKSLEKIISMKGPAKMVVALYYSPLAPLWSGLQSLPVEGLNLDFTNDGPALMKKMLAQPGEKEIGLGLLDVLNTKLEPVDELADAVRRWMERTTSSVTYATPAAGLELLPRDSALAKLQLLNTLRGAVNPRAEAASQPA